MGFRTVLIQSPAKLTYKNGFLIVRGDAVHTIHISEIHTLIIDSTMVSITAYCVCELMKSKVTVLFCDEARNPVGFLTSEYGSYDASGRVIEQAEWMQERKMNLWQAIIRQKIINQAFLLSAIDSESAAALHGYAADVQFGDMTNREGHAAKIYFNRIFGGNFNRRIKSDRNAALNYGYSILLSAFNKEITARGYITQLGIHHCNPYNAFNLSSDLMEPFRVLVDHLVLDTGDIPFDKEYKYRLLRIPETRVYYEDQNMSVYTCINRYVRNATDYLSERRELDAEMVTVYEVKSDACSADV